jgi:hypothetical protein
MERSPYEKVKIALFVAFWQKVCNNAMGWRMALPPFVDMGILWA